MIPKVKEARYIQEYKLWLRFSDGKSGVIDLSRELWGPMFEPLKDSSIFRQVEVHPELETLSWPNGADFAPEFLYKQVVAEQIAAERQ
ncbi:DUF2442 domain-containing protein [Salinisphaera sp.]|uniref:DUF2442 domain-containing protein n=1 Tax=Salinisphaera sp. TaxID=1914330 RepID=UPI002D7742B1|nr:DUF2442 domain-containing protein [Salinisphaera sp.]HET7314510.1 DUF2442 domain-containing protein [Salinisphaera sp.]